MLHRILITVGAVNFLMMGTVAAADFGGPKRGGDGIREVVQSATSTPYQARNEPSVDVEEKLNDYIDERGWTSDYTPGNFRIFQISTYSFPLRNPKRDRGFIQKRTIAGTMAQMLAKVEIIKGIPQVSSAKLAT